MVDSGLGKMWRRTGYNTIGGLLIDQLDNGNKHGLGSSATECSIDCEWIGVRLCVLGSTMAQITGMHNRTWDELKKSTSAGQKERQTKQTDASLSKAVMRQRAKGNGTGQ